MKNITGVYDIKTGKYYFGINNINGKFLHPIIRDRINNMPQDILSGYQKTIGADHMRRYMLQMKYY
ncbi:hypothetical protein JCM11672_33710 [Alkaliphilus crotonatoxidans]